MPIVRTRGRSPEFVLESRVTRYGALCNEWNSIHERGFILRLPSPMDSHAVAWHFIDDVHHKNVILTDVDGGSWKLSVCCNDASDGAVADGAIRVGAVG